MTQANLSVDNCLRSTFQKHVQYISKTSWGPVNNNSLTWWSVLKTSWRCLEDIFARCFEDVLKTSSRPLGKTSWRCLENVFARHIEDVLKTSWNCLEDVFWRGMTKANIFVLIKTSWRNLEDVFWRRKASSRRHQDVFIKANVCWVGP